MYFSNLKEGVQMSNDKPDGYVFGRPTKYRPEIVNEVVPFMSQGYSKEALAGHLKICKNTLYEWIEQYPDFSDAINKGTVESLKFWEKIGIENILNVSESDGKNSRSQSLNATAWIFNMKNRFKWNDNKEENDRPIVVNLNYDPEKK
jgi:transposase-like protein